MNIRDKDAYYSVEDEEVVAVNFELSHENFEIFNSWDDFSSVPLHS